MNGIIKAVLLVFAALCTLPTCPQNANYRRCSLTQMMIDHPMYSFNEQITSAFQDIPWNERFNNHDLGVKVVKFATQEYTDQTEAIASFLNQAKVAGRSVAKWFCWNKTTGKFDMSLVRARGLYDATELDKRLAALSVRGMAQLADAGENLIPNTFLIMHDICFSGKYSNQAKDFDRRGHKVSFSVKITSYIFSLDWSQEDMDEFYGVHYNGNTRFVADSKYSYTYRAQTSSVLEESSTCLSQKELIQQVVGRALDRNIAKLTKEYPKFKIMAPLTSVEPLECEIGLKEGITEESRFEVLEAEIDDNGVTHYTAKGTVRVMPGTIVDNRYTPGMESVQLPPTRFIVEKGRDFYPGMFLREI